MDSFSSDDDVRHVLARLEATWAGARDGLWDWDVAREQIRFSPRWKGLFGCAGEELPDRVEEWYRRVHPRDLEGLKHEIEAHLAGRSERLETEYRVLHKDGSWRWVRMHGQRRGEGLLGGSLSDVTAEKRAEDKLLQEVFHDPLTKLPNQNLFLDRIGTSLERALRRGTPVAVLYLDLDRFHTVNDSLGVDAGDELLVIVAERLSGLLRLGDTLARLGGDKFGLLMDGVRTPQEAVGFAAELSRVLVQPLVLEGHEVFAQASIGVALSSGEDQRPEDLLRDAITAMHRSKRDGSTPYELFDPDMSRQAKERMRLEADLRHAIERGEFRLHYQPIISFEEGSLAGFEALVRWEHPQHGLVRPDIFIPIAEETGEIIPLGRWVLGEACRQLRDWRGREASAKDVSVAVNLSARQFDDPGLVDEVARCIEGAALEPGDIKLEMTESVVMARTRENAARLQDLRDLGIPLLIDDFGTGYSSLASLQSFPLDSLKIDRSFVNRMEHEEGKVEIVRTILALARTLGLEVVAEGIETVEALDMLRSLECEYGQGYFFSSAIDGKAAEEWLAHPRRW